MKNRNPKMVKILNDRDLQFKCKVCGQVWFPESKRISWQCPNGCTLEELKQKHYEEVIRSES